MSKADPSSFESVKSLLYRRRNLQQEIRKINSELRRAPGQLERDKAYYLQDERPPLQLGSRPEQGLSSIGWSAARNAKTRGEQNWHLAQAVKARTWAEERKAKTDAAEVLQANQARECARLESDLLLQQLGGSKHNQALLKLPESLAQENFVESVTSQVRHLALQEEKPSKGQSVKAPSSKPYIITTLAGVTAEIDDLNIVIFHDAHEESSIEEK